MRVWIIIGVLLGTAAAAAQAPDASPPTTSADAPTQPEATAADAPPAADESAATTATTAPSPAPPPADRPPAEPLVVAPSAAAPPTAPPAAAPAPLAAGAPPGTTFVDEEPLPIPPGMEELPPNTETWRWQVNAVVGRTPDTAGDARSWDDSLRARGYGRSRGVFGVETSLLRVLIPAVALGARAGVRGRRWQHFDLEAATALGVDLQAVLDLRIPLDFAAVGVSAAAGLGFVAPQVNGVNLDLDTTWRVTLEAFGAFDLFGPVRVMFRLGYEFFPSDIAGFDAHMGGLRGAIGFEVRE